MSYNLYNLQINEIDGEIASLKMVLKTISNQERREKIKIEIEDLEKQREDLIKRFKGKYQCKIQKVDNNFSGPQGPNSYGEDNQER